MSSPPFELAPSSRTPLWKCWNCCLPSSNKDNESKSATTDVPRRPPFPDRSGMHHKELSLIVEETESKLRLELEGDDPSSKRSVGSSITSSSVSTGRASSGSRLSFSPPSDLLLTESTEDDDDDIADDGEEETNQSSSRQLAIRGPGPAGSSAALLELAWRVMVSILLLGWWRKPQPQPRRFSRRSCGSAEAPEESSSSPASSPGSPSHSQKG